MKNILVSLKNLIPSAEKNSEAPKPTTSPVADIESADPAPPPNQEQEHDEQCVNRKSGAPPEGLVNPSNPQSSIRNPLLDDSVPRRLTGKVAGLPTKIRNQVNEMLDEGLTYTKICAKLEELGYPGFVHQYIQRWKANGYQRWVRHQEQLEYARQEDETAVKLAETNPNCAANLIKANEIKLALRNGRLLNKFDELDDEVIINEKSKVYFQLSTSVTRQLGERTRRDKYELDAELKRLKITIPKDAEQKLRDMTAPLTEAQRIAIFDKIDEFLGIRLDPNDPHYAQDAASSASTLSQTSSSTLSNSPDPQSAITNPQSEAHSNTPETRPGELPPPLYPQSPISEFAPFPETPSEKLHASVATENQQPPVADDDRVNRKSSIVNPPHSNTLESRPEAECTPKPPSPPPQPQPVENNQRATTDDNCVNRKSSIVNPNNPQSAIENPQSPEFDPNLEEEMKSQMPISPLATTAPGRKQPHNHVPVLDRFGAWVAWIPRYGEGSYPKFDNPIGFENRRLETICWVNPKDPYPNAAPSPVDWVPVLNWEGRILYCVNQSSTNPIPPFYNAEPIRSRCHQTIVAWYADTKEDVPPDPKCGGAVA